jgi:hypothetical protein
MIFAFGLSKKYDLSLLSIEGRVLDRCRAFDPLACVDAHLWTVLINMPKKNYTELHRPLYS